MLRKPTVSIDQISEIASFFYFCGVDPVVKPRDDREWR